MSGLENPNPILIPGIANDFVSEEATMRLLNLSTIPDRVMSTYPGTSSRRVSSRNTRVPDSSHALTMDISLSLGSTLPVGLFGLQMYAALHLCALSMKESASSLKSPSSMRSNHSGEAPTMRHCWAYSANDGRQRRTLSPFEKNALGTFLMISEDPAPTAMHSGETSKALERVSLSSEHESSG